MNRGYAYEERLGARAAGQTVLRYLTARYRHSSREEWLERIDSGRVLVDGARVSPQTKLATGRSLTWLRPPWREPNAPRSFAILYRDESLLAVAKPRGLPTMPGARYLENTLLYRVTRHEPSASPLHRLGRETSGIVLFARTSGARARMCRLWQRGEVVRRYRALVRGLFPAGRDVVIDEPIGEVPHAILGTVAGRSPSGKAARTVARLLSHRPGRPPGRSLVEVEILTGRTHQIRIHLAAAGFPLDGDPLYPVGGVPSPTSQALPGDGGFWLHAGYVGMPLADGRTRVIHCAPPAVLRESA